MQICTSMRTFFFFMVACSFFQGAFLCGAVFTSDFLTVDLVKNDKAKILKIRSIFGEVDIIEPVLIDLITSSSFGRLTKIRQHGNWHYCGQPDEYTRFEHSINVFLLVRQSGGIFLEQVAALLHDVSHTAFSHAGASFFEDDFIAADHLQDALHEEYLVSSQIGDILRKYGIAIAQIMPEQEEFIRLEQPLPALCADRIEYNITGGLYEGLLTLSQAKELAASLHFSLEENSWYFDNVDSAYLFARNAIYMATAIWTSPYSTVSSKMLGYALRRAASLGLVTRDDVLYGSDDDLFAKLSASNDAILHLFLGGFQFPENVFTLRSSEDVSPLFCKFRGINPTVFYDGQILPLSQVCRPFAWYYSHMKSIFASGWSIAYSHSIDQAIKAIS